MQKMIANGGESSNEYDEMFDNKLFNYSLLNKHAKNRWGSRYKDKWFVVHRYHRCVSQVLRMKMIVVLRLTN